MIEIIGLTKMYGRKTALDNINLTLPSKGLILIRGENGSGKTTLMNMLGALDTPNKGKIIVDGIVLSGREKELSKYRENYVGFIFQNSNLFEDFTVEENLNILGKKNLEKITKFLQINDLLTKEVNQLSGGERQRVAIARAVLKNPKIILADEPTSSIDYESKNEIFKLLKALSHDRLVVVVSHDLEDTPEYVDVVIELKQGRILRIFEKEQSSGKNEIPLNNNHFDAKTFAFKNTFIKQKKFVRSSIFLILSFIFIMLTMSIAMLDFVDMHANTMELEKDDLLYFEAPNYDDKITEESSLKYLENHKISKSPIEIGYNLTFAEEYLNNIGIAYPGEINVPYFRPRLRPTYFSIKNLPKVDYGKKPENAVEIAVTSYIADTIIEFGLKTPDEELYKPSSYEDIINDKKEFAIGTQKVYIVGIVKMDYQKYEKYKKSSSDNVEFQFFQDLVRNAGSYIYVADEFFELKRENGIPLESIPNFKTATYLSSDYNSIEYPSETVKVFKTPIALKDGSSLYDLNRGEIIVNEQMLKAEEIASEDCLGKTIELRVGLEYTSKNLNLTIKGISENEFIYVNEEDLYDIFKMSKQISKFVIHESDKNTVKEMLENFKPSYYVGSLYTNYSSNFDKIEEIFNIIIYFFLGISIILTIVTTISISNQILDSIELHKNEISILKSLGVTDGKISLIFVLETSGILILSYLYALLTFILVRILFNWTASRFMSFKVDFIKFNFPLILGIILISLILALFIELVCYRKIKNTSPEVLFKKNFL